MNLKTAKMSPSRPSQSYHMLLCQSRCTQPQVVHAPARKLEANENYHSNIIKALTEVVFFRVEAEMLEIFHFVFVVALSEWLHFIYLLFWWGGKDLLKGNIKAFLWIFLHPIHPVVELFSQCMKTWFVWIKECIQINTTFKHMLVKSLGSLFKVVICNISVEPSARNQTAFVVQWLVLNTILLVRSTVTFILDTETSIQRLSSGTQGIF